MTKENKENMKMRNFLFCMSALLVAGALADYTPRFEDFEDTGWQTYWFGDTNIVDGSVSTVGIGVPGGQSAGVNAKVLAVEGVVSNTLWFSGMDASRPAQIDMLVKVAASDGALVLPAEDTDAVHVAVAIDSSTNLCIYCKDPSGDVAFHEVKSAVTPEWMRVSLNFDYESGRCQVLIDGELCISSCGYKAATGGVTGGAWYNFANTSVNKPSALKIVGTTAIDDVYAAQAAGGINVDGAVATVDNVTVGGQSVSEVSVEKAWLNSNGVTSASLAATSSDDSGLTVIEKYVYGLEVDDGKKMALADMQPVSDSKIKFVIPGVGARQGSFKLKSANSPDAVSWSSTTNFEGNAATFNLSSGMGDGNVKYFKVEYDSASAN